MTQVILCEKPSLAKTVATALKNNGNQFEYSQEYKSYKNDKYHVIPAFGHLLQLYDLEEYPGNYSRRWTLENLPFVPEEFEYTIPINKETKVVDKGIEKQFNYIKSSVNKPSISSVIHCGDSDREGEIIIRNILNKIENNKKVYRLWLPDQTEQTILKQLNEMKDDKEYDNLANEGYARTFVDWSYGINLTRYATIMSGTLLKVGRVKSAIINAIYDRDKSIKEFVPKKYFAIISKEETNNEVIELKSEKKFDLDQSIELNETIRNYNSSIAKVIDIKTERKVVEPPKLFSQSTLQNYLSKKYNFAPNETLNLVQQLYEKGYVSYPRTPTEYLATAEKDRVKEILNAINDSKLEFKDKKRIFDDSKIESHSAIIPTTKIPEVKDLDLKQLQTYETILNRFKSVFYKENCEIDVTTMTIQLGDYETFTKKGNVTISKGFKNIEEILPEKEDNLPSLNINDEININFKAELKETSPPKYYTVESFNNFLKNPFKKEKNEKDDDSEEYKALLEGSEIGTEATRSGIIEECIKAEYIKLDKKNYSILPKGIQYVEILKKLDIDMSKEKTVELNKALKNVYLGKISIKDSVDFVKKELEEIVIKDKEIEKVETRNIVGKCPKCNKNVVEAKSTYQCESNKYENVNGKFTCVSGCGFSLLKTLLEKNISEANIKSLLETGKTKLIKGFKGKKGSFDAYVSLNENFGYIFEFLKKEGKNGK